MQEDELSTAHKIAVFILSALAVALAEKAVEKGYHKLVLDNRNKSLDQPS